MNRPGRRPLFKLSYVPHLDYTSVKIPSSFLHEVDVFADERRFSRREVFLHAEDLLREERVSKPSVDRFFSN